MGIDVAAFSPFLFFGCSGLQRRSASEGFSESWRHKDSLFPLPAGGLFSELRPGGNGTTTALLATALLLLLQSRDDLPLFALHPFRGLRPPARSPLQFISRGGGGGD